MKKFALLSLSLALLTRSAQAQQAPQLNPGTPGPSAAGLNNLVQPSSGEPDINAAYAVTAEAGSWMICAASYQGPDAPELANKLCSYLREHRYPTYVYNRGNEERKQLQEELDRWQRDHPGSVKKWKLAHPQEEQLAVLIGGFRDVDAANSELKKVRKMELPALKLNSGKPAFDTYDVYEQTPGSERFELKRYPVNPFHTAFAVRNPAVPQQRRTAAKVDPMWKKLNSEEPRSLFKCPKPWTLAVQEYVGAQVIQPTSASGSFLEKLGWSDHDLGKRLDASAMQAQQVCDLLKKLGYKSYVLHTRNSSVVTVGEFSSTGDPELLRVQQQLAKFSFKDKLGNEAVKLFARPLPMEVPK
jgi:hypothetical protein